MADLVAGLRRYIDGDYPVYPPDGDRARALHEFLFSEKPDPRAFVALFPLPPKRADVDEQRMRSDLVGTSVVTSFIRRVAEEPETRDRAALYDAIVAIGVPFAFDTAWGDSHTNTSVMVTEFLAEAKFPVCKESRDAVTRHFPSLLAEWRGRVTRKGSSVFFGITLRHVGAAGAAALCAEWGGMDANEREDLLLRLAYEDEAGRAVRERMVGALLDPGPDVREAAFAALRAHGAPLGDLDASARDSELEKALPALRRWAEETES